MPLTNSDQNPCSQQDEVGIGISFFFRQAEESESQVEITNISLYWIVKIQRLIETLPDTRATRHKDLQAHEQYLKHSQQS